MNNQTNPTNVGTKNVATISKAELTTLRTEKQYSVAQVAKHYGISEAYATRAIKEAGLPARVSNKPRQGYTLVD